MVSDLAGVEFASAIVRRVQIPLFTAEQARSALSVFDECIARSTIRAEIMSAGVPLPDRF
jgi:hypothetical protein